jgi:hypothetical protein
MYKIDNLLGETKCIDNKWVILRPINYRYRSIIQRLYDAWLVFTGKCEAIEFYKQ